MTDNNDHISSVLRELGSEPHNLPLESVLEHIPTIRRRRTRRTVRRGSVVALLAVALVAVTYVGLNLQFADRPSAAGNVVAVSSPSVVQQRTTDLEGRESATEKSAAHSSDVTENDNATVAGIRTAQNPRTSPAPLQNPSPRQSRRSTSRQAEQELRPYADVSLNTDVLGTLVKVVGKHDAIDVVDHGNRDVMCLEAVCAGGDRREISCMGSSPVPEVVTRPNGEVVLRRHRTTSAVVDVVGVTSRIDGTSMLAWYDCGMLRDRLPTGTTCTAYRLEKMGDVTAKRVSDGSVVVTFLNGNMIPNNAIITIQGLDDRPFGPLTRIAGTEAQEIGIVGSLPAGLHKISWTTSDGQHSRLVVIP